MVRDRRRIDPDTGQVRQAPEPDEAAQPEQAVPAEGAAAPEEPNREAELKEQLDERTADLQRLQAEYANYRKRIDRDREVVTNTAKASVAQELLSVLDDIERAHQHGDLTGAFKAVADKLVATLERVGLESFGHEGEAFDPSVHEAVQHDTSPEVSGPTVTAVLRRGYRFGDRIVRAALVGVTDHEPGPADAAPAEAPAPPAAPDAKPGGPEANDWFASADVDTPADRADDQI
ncbi:MAG TPA: nucleotide exchange factor GrpE [Actinophytocola sp.]|uniref:nucleotide exchange factor GrpE n=1 Tax=Actinophytocola sp. TaxID=1872138 RepID=UPI002F938590